MQRKQINPIMFNRLVTLAFFIFLGCFTACQPSNEPSDDRIQLETPSQTLPPSVTPSSSIQIETTEAVTMTPSTNSTIPPYLIADSIMQRIHAIETAVREGQTDLAYLSDALLQVRADGAIEMVFHAKDSIGPDEEAELEALGAEIVSSTADLTWPEGVEPPSGLGQIQAWLGYDQVANAAQLSWVVNITPPAYEATD